MEEREAGRESISVFGLARSVNFEIGIDDEVPCNLELMRSI